MRKALFCALMLGVVVIAGCKKAPEEKQDQTNAPAAEEGRARRNRARNQQPATPLEIYNETTLVTSVPPNQPQAFANAKVKMGNAMVDGILLRDLLKKYNLKGNNVILAGPRQSTPLTWEQANTADIYVVLTRNARFIVYAPKPPEKLQLPRRLIRLTVAAKADMAAAQPKPAPKKSPQQ